MVARLFYLKITEIVFVKFRAMDYAMECTNLQGRNY